MDIIPSLKPKASWPTCISNTIYKFLDVLINDLPKHVLHSCNVDHKIEVVPRSTPPSKSPYWLNINIRAQSLNKQFDGTKIH
jgi:hypothetical protein